MNIPGMPNANRNTRLASYVFMNVVASVLPKIKRFSTILDLGPDSGCALRPTASALPVWDDDVRIELLVSCMRS